MADALQTAQVSCRGGLDLRSTTQDLLQKPGFATTLTNYEQNIGGGYRRINGFTSVNETALPGSGQIYGAAVYNDGYVMCRGDAIYFSFNGEDWEQVNKDVSTLSNQATLQAAAALPKTAATLYTFDTFTQGGGNGRIDLLIHSDVGAPAVLTIIGGDLVSAEYRYVEITSGSVMDTTYGIVHSDQHIIAGDPVNPSTFYVSNIADMEDFITGQSGAYSVADPIVGIKSFRDILYIFCQNSIWQARGLNSGTPEIKPVTRNTGCVSGFTIQEIGGDLIFLANDGLRTLGATSRIDDVALGTSSIQINERIQQILSARNSLQFTSCVIKSKNQYRLFYTNPSKSAENQGGLIATFYPDPQSGIGWSFSETNGIEVTALNTGIKGGEETIVHGNIAGGFYRMDFGTTFDGVPIDSTYQTPYFDLGDSGVRKNLHKVILYLNPEGPVVIKLNVIYDYEDNDITHQPLEYTLDQIDAPAVYGSAIYGTSIYGARLLPTTRVHTQGSGFTASLKFKTTGEATPFTIQGFNTEFMASGRI